MPSLPSVKTVRDRIESVGRDFHAADVGKVPDYADDEQYRMGFMYTLLIAGRISEVFGKYAPQGYEAFNVEFEVDGDKAPAALFAVKTAKRKTKRGWIFRPAAIPLDPEYEPWVEKLLEYMQSFEGEHPFMVGPSPDSSQRYAQRVAEVVFKGLMWPIEKYNRTVYLEADKDQIMKTKLKGDGLRYLIEYEDGSRKWCNDIAAIPKSVNVLDHWNPFTAHALRKRRTMSLEFFYEFTDKDKKTFGGWEKKGSESHVSESMRRYLYLDLTEAKQNLYLLKQIAAKYFPKLLKPFIELVNLEI